MGYKNKLKRENIVKSKTSLKDIFRETASEKGQRSFDHIGLINTFHQIDRVDPSSEEIEELIARCKTRIGLARNLTDKADFMFGLVHLNWLNSIRKPQEIDFDFCNVDGLNTDEFGRLVGEENSIKKDDIVYYLPKLEQAVSQQLRSTGIRRRELFESNCEHYLFAPILKSVASSSAVLSRRLKTKAADAKIGKPTSFLRFANKQLIQNIFCFSHANLTFNLNYNSVGKRAIGDAEGLDYFFGAVSYVAVSKFDNEQEIDNFRKKLQNVHSKLEAKFVSSLDNYLRLKKDGAVELPSFILLTYCDTGPGMVRHLREFLTATKPTIDSLNIKKVLDEKLSSRGRQGGSGMGLSDIRFLASYSKASFVIETSDSCYAFDGVSGEETVDGSSRLTRGNIASILIEI